MKHACHDGTIRTFIGSRGPVHLVKVEREPKMYEVDRYGNEVVKETSE